MSKLISFELSRSGLKEPLYIILEDFYLVQESRDANFFIEHLVQSLPETVQLLIATKVRPRLDSLFYVDSHMCFTLDKEDLRFTKYEIATLYEKMHGYTPTSDEVRRIQDGTEGWGACLGLAKDLAELADNPIDASHIFAQYEGPVTDLDLFLEKFLERLNEKEQKVLVVAACAVRISSDACDQVLHTSDSLKILEDISRKNSLLSEIDKGWFRFHNLFRDFLLSRLASLTNALNLDFTGIHRELAMYYEVEGLQIEAFEHYRKAEDLEKSANLLERMIREVHSRSIVLKERDWLLTVPEYSIRNHPWLLVFKGRCQEYEGDYASALKTYENALRILQTIGDQHGQLICLYYIGKIQQIQQRTDAMQTLEAALGIAESLTDSFMSALILRKIGSEYRSRGDYNDAIRILNDAVNLTKLSGNHLGLSFCYHTLANVYRSKGKYEDALRYYDQAIEIRKRQGDKYGTAKSLNNKGVALRLKGNVNEARGLLEETLEIKRSIGDQSGISRTLQYLGELYILTDEYDKALDVLNKALRAKLEMRSEDTYGIAKAKNCLGQLYNIWGKWMQAVEYLEGAKSSSERTGFSGLLATATMYLGDSLQIKGDYRGALRNYKVARAFFEQQMIYQRIADSSSRLVGLLITMRKYDEAFQELTATRTLLLHEGFNEAILELDLLSARCELFRDNVMEAKRIFRSIEEKSLDNCCQSMVADYYLAMSEFERYNLRVDDAIECLRKANYLYRSLGRNYEYTITLVKLAKIYLLIEEPDQCKHYWLESRSLAEKNNYDGILSAIG
jgi:ATP/maltotriose-dependent transcriptional regulator MalT